MNDLLKPHQCPRCSKNRLNNSPISYTWWTVMGHGYMCWNCFDKLKEKNK